MRDSKKVRRIRAEKWKLRRHLLHSWVGETINDFLTQSQKELDTRLVEIKKLCHLHDAQFDTLLEREKIIHTGYGAGGVAEPDYNQDFGSQN